MPAEKRTSRRPPTWLTLTSEERSRPGGRLLLWLFSEAAKREHSLRDLSRNLGVSYGYLSQLRTGHRSITTVTRAFTSACARYLRAPRVAVLIAAEQLTPGDFHPAPDALPQLCSRAIQYIRTDPEWGPLLPRCIETDGIEYQFPLIKAYERATGAVLLPGCTDVASCMALIERLDEGAGEHPTTPTD